MSQPLQLAFDAKADLDRRVNALLFDHAQPWPLTAEQRSVLRELQWHKGAHTAVTIATLSEKLKLTDRAIKEAVRSLVVDFKLPVVGLRRPPFGYFLAITAEEIAEALSPLSGEIRELARRMRALESGEYVRELLGQIAIELDKESA